MTIIDYRYSGCGLDNVILRDLPVLQDDEGSNVITIPNIGLLHRVLTVAVASKTTGLQPKEVRFLRTELGLTQSQLAALVGREVQAVGRWERGENPIDTSAEIVIRAKALQHVTTETIPPMDRMSGWTAKAASEPAILIDARDPAHYQPLAA